MPQPSDREIEVFNAALELAAAEQGAYLDKVCVGDAGLRQRVEELLRVENRARGFLASPVGGQAAPGGSIRHLGIPEMNAGSRIDRYKLLQQIGEGGCGIVYMAEQASWPLSGSPEWWLQRAGMSLANRVEDIHEPTRVQRPRGGQRAERGTGGAVRLAGGV